jgi:DNA-binding CsgD family transcriptional regulator
MVLGATATRQREEIAQLCNSVSNPATDIETLFETVSRRLRTIVPYSGSTWFATDPSTLLATRPVYIENIEAGHCTTFWHREFLVQDTNLFADLAREDVPAATLYERTDGRPARSARYREFAAPQGYGDELRAVLRLGRSTWGVMALHRDKNAEPFSHIERDLVAGLTRPLAGALRSRVIRNATLAEGLPGGPGMLLFGPDSQLLSCNDDARGWLAALPDELNDEGIIPVPVYSVLSHARAIADGREVGRARLRLLTRSGRWVLMHASAMNDSMTAVVIETAQANEIAPIIVEAYELSPREQQITQLVARGANTTQMAQELLLSTHTVRDYVKQVFEKVGVTSRGELVAKLFAEHYSPDLHAEPVPHAQI